MFTVSALLLDDALKLATSTPLTNGAINETLRQFAPLSDDRLLSLVDCRESSTLVDLLLKGTPNSVIDWIKVRAVWGSHVRLDEHDFLTPQVRQCVPNSVWRCAVLLQGPGVALAWHFARMSGSWPPPRLESSRLRCLGCPSISRWSINVDDSQQSTS